MASNGHKQEGPDQARSWAIALAACVINSLLSGIGRTTGLFYVSLIETYKVTRLQANLPFTVRNVVRNLAGPVVGAIGQKYGPRDVTIVGGILASLGILLCAFPHDILWITALWGGMHGFGVALANTLFQVVVTQYFLKYRATATGLAISGACIGAFFLPVLLEYCLFNFGLSGAFLITGGFMLNVLPAAIMMKEPPWIRRKEDLKYDKEDETKIARKISKPATIMTSIQEETNDLFDVDTNGTNANSLKTVENGFNEKREQGNGIDNNAFVGSKTDLSSICQEEPQRDVVVRTRLRTISVGDVSLTVSTPVVTDVQQETSIYKALLMISRDPMFHLISLSLGAFAMLFDPTITVIVDYLMDKGLSEDLAKYFISMLALGDLVGRMCFGWVTDKDYMSVPKFMMLMQVGQGVIFLILPMLYSFDTLIASMVIFGLLSGANLVMFPILVTRYLQSVQSLAIGSIQFFSGILSFAIPPIIGYFRDEIGSYDGMFYITGGLSVFTGFCWLLEPILLKLRPQSKTQHSVSMSAPG